MTQLSDIQRDYISATEAASLLGVSRQRVYKLQANDTFPRQAMLFGVAVFNRAEIIEWKRKYRQGRESHAI